MLPPLKILQTSKEFYDISKGQLQWMFSSTNIQTSLSPLIATSTVQVVQTKDVILEVFALIWVRTSSLGHARNIQLFQKVPPRLSIPHSLEPLQN